MISGVNPGESSDRGVPARPRSTTPRGMGWGRTAPHDDHRDNRRRSPGCRRRIRQARTADPADRKRADPGPPDDRPTIRRPAAASHSRCCAGTPNTTTSNSGTSLQPSPTAATTPTSLTSPPTGKSPKSSPTSPTGPARHPPPPSRPARPVRPSQANPVNDSAPNRPTAQPGSTRGPTAGDGNPHGELNLRRGNGSVVTDRRKAAVIPGRDEHGIADPPSADHTHDQHGARRGKRGKARVPPPSWCSSRSPCTRCCPNPC